jgi:hypothetical protein
VEARAKVEDASCLSGSHFSSVTCCLFFSIFFDVSRPTFFSSPALLAPLADVSLWPLPCLRGASGHAAVNGMGSANMRAGQ